MASSTKAFVTRIVPSAKLLRRDPVVPNPAFNWRFGLVHAYSYAAGTYLDNPLHALHDASKRRWAAKQEPLWLSIVAVKTNGENSRCVRSWLTRRLRVSLAESFRKNGYGTDGHPLPGSQRDQPLIGTAQFFTERIMLKTRPEALQEQCDTVVREIIRLQKWNRGPGRSPPERSSTRKQGTKDK